jgi:hypothetical protein
MKMEILTLEAIGGNYMGRVQRSVRKIVSLYLAFVMALPLVGVLSFSIGAPSEEDRKSFDVTIGALGNPTRDNTREPMTVRLEAVAENGYGVPDDASPYSEINSGGYATYSGPTPHDAPFGSDILIFNDPYNQTNPSIDYDSNNNTFVAFEHDWGLGTDIYLSKSSDGGQNWGTIPIVNTGRNESCPSMAIDYSPSAGSERWYVFYETDELEYAWSDDGTTWSRNVLGGTFWSTVTCPYVQANGDFVVVVAQKYDDQTMMQDTWYILYTLDGFQTYTAYYWVLWSGAAVSQPRVTIIDDDEVLTAFEVHDTSTPGDDWHDTLMALGELTGGGPSTDTWDYWVWGSGFNNQVPTAPTVQSYGRHVIVTHEALAPQVNLLNTSSLFCAWSGDIQHTGASWDGCNNDEWFLAFDENDVLDQKFPKLHMDGMTVHATWLNGTDVNYRYSPDGGNNWMGEPNTGLPLKVNEPGNGTALRMYHSPDITFFGGKLGIVWHDTRVNGSIYFNTLGNLVFFTIYTDPLVWDAWVREVGDMWHTPPYTYLWTRGTNHDIEAVGTITVGGVVLSFCYWDDGSPFNPRTVNANSSYPMITAVYCCSNSTLSVNTSPTGLLVEIDVVQYTAPQVICCDNSSIHKVHAPSPQVVSPGVWYEFSHWSDLGTQTHFVNVNGIVKLTAFFDLVTNQDPVADAGGPYFGRKNLNVNFTGLGSFDSDGSIVAYEWDFGDGNLGLGAVVNHTYTSKGNYTVILNVTDNSGSWDIDITYALIEDLPPGAPGVLGSILSGGSLADVEISWSLSADDGGIENDVGNYEIYTSTGYDPTGASYLLLDAVGPGLSSYVHVGGGHGNNNVYFYMICAVDDDAQKTCDAQQSVKYAKSLNSGQQLLSIPALLSDTSTPNVFQTVSFTKITYYDAMAGKRHNWKTFDTRKPYSTLKNVNHTMALWVDVTSPSWFTVAGLVPQQTTIHLVTGWNFVGYASFTSADVNTNLAGANWQNVETFDSTNTPWLLKRLNGGDLMFSGEGYWIHVSSDFDWVLSN